MRTLTKTILQTLLVVVASLGMVEAGLGQFNSSNSDIRDIVRRIQTDTTNLRNSAQNAVYRGHYIMNELNLLLVDLDSATTQFDRGLFLTGRRQLTTCSLTIEETDPERSATGKDSEMIWTSLPRRIT